MPPVVALPARPGIFLYESKAGATPPATATLNRCYILGSATTGDANVPTATGSFDEFSTLFGSSSAITLNSLRAYWANLQRALYFVRVRPNPIGTVTVATVAAGNYDLTIGGNLISIPIPASPAPTAQIVIDTVVAAINNNTVLNQLVQAEYVLSTTTGLPQYTPAQFYLRSKDGNIFTLVASTANLTVSPVAAPATLGYLDWIAAIDRLQMTEQESELGFMVAPEAFYSLNSQFERTVVGNTMESACRSLGWVAMLDPGNPTLIDHPIKAKADALNYTAIRGHSASYYPYAQNASLADVSPALMTAAFALQCYEEIGIQKPPAGSNFPFRGITKLRYTLSQSQQDDLAQSRVNTIIYKPGIGFIPGDTLTRSTDPNFKMISTRVIMSCVERSIYRTLDASGLLFQAIGGRGLFYIKLKNVIEGVLARFYEGGALYGDRPEDAYAIKCDETVQNAADLEAGIVTAEVYAVPAATARQIRGTVFRVAIGNISQAILSGAA